MSSRVCAKRHVSASDIWLRGAVITLAVTFLHNFAFNAGTFYLAVYFQVGLPRGPFASTGCSPITIVHVGGPWAITP